MSPECKLEIITPDIAREYLTHNNGNRKIRVAEVESYMREIKRGDFITTHQGVAFDTNGELVDGQHRLMAIALSGIPVEMFVTRNLHPKAKMVVDRGQSRTMHDTMSFSFTDDSERSKMLRNTHIPSAINQLVRCSYKTVKLSSFETLKILEYFEPHITEVYRMVATKNITMRNVQVSSAAIAAMYCGVDKDVIAKFFAVFHKADIHNCENYNIQAVLNWRRQLDDAKMRGLSVSPKKIYLGTQNAIWHFANNTNVTRVVNISAPKYDVKNAIIAALGIQE